MNLFDAQLSQCSPIETLLGGVLLILFLIQLLFYLLLYRKPYTYQKRREERKVADHELEGISVIITAKNNADELKKNLPLFLEQDYPNYEVIVVNSGSTDDTDLLLRSAGQKYAQLYHTYLPAEADATNEKKLALTIGIKAAKHENLLFTEAYCRPTTTGWISAYGEAFAAGKEIILGFNRLIIDKQVRMRSFIRFDNLIHHLKFLSMAIAGKPFMGIGRNMAYKKAFFFNNKGFSSILNIDHGEDDLFINRIAQGSKSGVVLSPDSMTETDSIESFHTWRLLKSKYLYTKQFYRGVSTALFTLETFSKYAFYLALTLSIALSLISGNNLLLLLALLTFLGRCWFLLLVTNKNSLLLDKQRYSLNILLFDLFQPLNNVRFRKYANSRYNARR